MKWYDTFRFHSCHERWYTNYIYIWSMHWTFSKSTVIAEIVFLYCSLNVFILTPPTNFSKKYNQLTSAGEANVNVISSGSPVILWLHLRWDTASLWHCASSLGVLKNCRERDMFLRWIWRKVICRGDNPCTIRAQLISNQPPWCCRPIYYSQFV